MFGIGLIAYSIAFYHHHTPFPGYAALVPCLGTALLIWANSYGSLTLVGKLFSRPTVVRIGQISYSLYLWHWPLIAYGDYLFLLESTEARWLVVILSCWLGYLSWRWVETPFREKRWLTSRRAIFGLFLTYAVTCLCLGTAYRLIQDSPLLPPKPTRSGIFEADLDRPTQKLPSLGRGSEPVSFLLWGDSHAMSLAPTFSALGEEYGVHGLQLTYSAMAPLLSFDYAPTSKMMVTEEFKRKWAHRALDTATSHNIKVVFLVAFWKSYSGPHFSQELQQTVQEFNRRGVQVVFVADNPEQLTDPVRHTRLSFQEDWIAKPTLIPSKEHQQKNAVIYEALATFPLPSVEFTTIDLAPSVLKWSNFLSEDGHLLYADNHHLSDKGALKLRHLFEPIFEELVQTSRIPKTERAKVKRRNRPTDEG